MFPIIPTLILRFVLCIAGICIHQSISAQTKILQNGLQLFGIFNNPATLETQIVPIFISGKQQAKYAENEAFHIQGEGSAPYDTKWYGSATLAGDPGSGNLFYADKSGNTPAIWSVSNNGKRSKIILPGNLLPGHCLTKMAMGPDGYVYAISTGLNHVENYSQRVAIVIRFKPCNTTGCASVEILGYLSAEDGYSNAMTYSGDMAFSAKGDLFLFGTEIDTTMNYYKGAHIYKIAAGKIQHGKKPGPIPIKYIGQIKGMGVRTGIDSTVITGVAFEPGGTFIISVVDKYSGSRVHFYRGSIGLSTTIVRPIELQYNIPPGFVVSDLASFTIPVIQQPASKNITSELAVTR